MKLKNIFLGSVLILTLSNCTSGIKKILKVGSIQQKNFISTIPFDYTKTGHIVLKVSMKGKEYDFILDTGATNIISEELANELGVKVIGSSEILDINNKPKSLDFVELEDVQVGGINFKNTIGSILDLKKGELDCLGVDGLLGSNLMRHAVWDFDFQKKTITITDDERQLNIPANHSETKIYVGDAFQASITTKFNDRKVLNNIIDLGNAGAPKLAYVAFNKLKGAKNPVEYLKGSGGSGFGAFGRSAEKKSSYTTKINSLKIGNYELNAVIVNVKDGQTNLGLSVFKNSRIIFNWKKKSFKMIEQSTRKKGAMYGFGFYPVFDNNKLYVDFLYNNTDASRKLKYRDIIININNKDYSSISEEEWCEFVQDDGLPYLKESSIKIQVLRDGMELEFNLKKVKLL